MAEDNLTNVEESSTRIGSKEVSVHSLLVQEEETRTTVMMRDIPNSYSTSRLLELFDHAGFWGTYDFVYLPIDFRTNMSLGYAFVNFVSSRDAQQFMMYFEGFSSWHFSSPKCARSFGQIQTKDSRST